MKAVENLFQLNSDTILNSIAEGVIVIGLDHKIIFINQAAEEMLRDIGEEGLFCGNKCSEIKGLPSCTLGCLVNMSMKTGSHICNYETVVGNGRKRKTLHINTALLRDENGNVIGGIETIRDVSLINELKDELMGKYSFDNIVGRNYKIHEVYELLLEVSPTRSTVLITGETGTGKELIANAIHRNSPRKDRAFVKVNCAALAEGVLESELFGHVKGAFTGAISDKQGRFELADGGTIFLDEIGEIAPATQAKLLRVLQEGEFEKVGGTKTMKADVRVIAATNRDLKAATEKGTFREDLYYRLKVVPIHLPPLRERKDDIPLLVKSFLDKFNTIMNKRISGISPKCIDLLTDYSYPGNIRELENIIEHAFVRCQGGSILPEHLPKDLQNLDIIEKAMNSSEPLKELERETILRTLDETGWKYTEASKRLRMCRTTLWRKMKDMKIERARA